MTDPIVAVAPEIAPFVTAAIARPDLHARLGRHQIPDDFVAEAIAVAHEIGVELDEAALRHSIKPDPLGMGRWGGAPVSSLCWPRGDWLPTASIPEMSPPQFDWAWFGDRQLSEPFYFDTARRAGCLPFNLLCRTRTDLSAVVAGAASEPSLPLAGLVFHMSRCGSTLLARMLGAVPRNVVASEPEPLDAVLLWAWREQVPLEQAVPSVRAVAAALGRRRGTAAERFFIKADAWHTLSLPLLHAAFPEVPWVYLFREPLEVLASHQRQPGMQIVAGVMPEALFGIAGGAELPPLDYAARALDAISRAAIAHRELGHSLFLNYDDVIVAATTKVATHFGLDLDAQDHAAMIAVARGDAKAPEVVFTPDAERKRSESSAAVHAAAKALAATHRDLMALTHRP